MQKAKISFPFFLLFLIAAGPLSAQATMVKDINPGSSDGLIATYQQIVKLGSLLYFPADDGVHGRELWKSNGVSAGTQMVTDLNPASGVGANPDQLTVIGNRLFFVADDGVHGLELWVMQGSNPPQLLELEPGAAGAIQIKSIIGIGSEVYFLATTPSLGGELWKYDGVNPPQPLEATAGPVGTDPAYLAYGNDHIWGHWDELAYDPSNNTLYWFGYGTYLWKYVVGSSLPPSSAGPFYSINPHLQPPVALNGYVYFSGYTGPQFENVELFRYDGTSISLFHEFVTGNGHGLPSHLIAFNGNIFFLARDPNTVNKYSIEKIDGNQNLTVGFGGGAFQGVYSTDGYPPSNPFLVIGNQLYVRNGNKVYVLNSTAQQFNGPVLNNFSTAINGIHLVKTGQKFFYESWVAEQSPQIFYHDGNGSTAVTNFDGICDCFIGQLTLRGGKLYFPALTVAGGWELWKLDPAQFFAGQLPHSEDRRAVLENNTDTPAPFALSPNPADESCTLRFDTPIAERFALTVLDNAGKKVLEAVLPEDASEYAIPTANLPKGLYFIQLRGEKTNQVYHSRMVLSH